MRVRKLLCIVFACFMLVNCLGISAGAANVETQRDMKLRRSRNRTLCYRHLVIGYGNRSWN